MSTEDRIRLHFDAREPSIRPYADGVERAISLGRRYRLRRKVAGSLGGLALAIAGVSGATLLGSSNGSIETEEPTAHIDTPFTNQIPGFDPVMITPTLTDIDVQWSGAESTLGHANALISGTGAFYVLTTAPGETGVGPKPPESAIYSSSAGGTWTHQLLSDEGWAQGFSVWSAGLAEHAGLLYLVTTSPGLAEAGPPHRASVATSADGGATWTLTDLPSLAQTPASYRDSATAYTSTRVAAGSAGVLAAVRTQFVIDYRAFAPAEYRGASFQAFPTDSGLAVFDERVLAELDGECRQASGEGELQPLELRDPESLPEPCQHMVEFYTGGTWPDAAVVFQASWDELGLQAPDSANSSELFISVDGATFERVESPFSPDASLGRFIATDSGFLALELGHPSGPYWQGPQSQISTKLWGSPDGRNWELVADLPLTEHHIQIQDIGMVGGDPVLVATFHGPIGQNEGSRTTLVARFTSNGWEAIDIADLLGDDSVDRWPSDVAIGPLGLVIIVESWENIPDLERGDAAWPGRPKTDVLFSPDLVTWTRLDVSGDVPSPVETVTQAAVGSTQILLRGGYHTGDAAVWAFYDFVGTPG